MHPLISRKVAIRKMSEKKFSNNRDNQETDNLFQICGPTGGQLTINNLPNPNTTRWVIRRKAEVVAGVRGGLISLKEALLRYNLSLDEFRSWQRLFENHGMRGLRTTKTNMYRTPHWSKNKTPTSNSYRT